MENPKLEAQGTKVPSVCSQVMTNPTDLEEVISPLKDMLANRTNRGGMDERGGRRGKTIKSRLGTRPDETLHAKKKITRSPHRATYSRKRQAVSICESPKKRLYDNHSKRDNSTIPLPPKEGPSNGNNKEDPGKLVVDEIPPANPI